MKSLEDFYRFARNKKKSLLDELSVRCSLTEAGGNRGVEGTDGLSEAAECLFLGTTCLHKSCNSPTEMQL